MSRPTIPTSVGWCREVPEDWGFAPLRQLGAVVSGGTPSGDEENWNGDIPFVTPPDLRSVVGGSVSKTERTLTRSATESGSAVVPANTVLVSIRAPIGYVARTTMEAAFNQGCRALVPKSGVDSTYLTYALVAAGPELESLGRGSTFTELSAAQFSAIKVPSPPLDEQRAIADYLDRETARIDTLIEEIETSIALSGERRSALITAAVTGQIDVTSSAAGEMGRQDYDSGGVNFSLGERRRSRLRYCLKVDPPVDPSVRENPYLEVSFLPMEAIGEHGGLDLTREIPAQEASSGYTSVADGDVVLAKVTPCFENGKGALVFGLKNGFGFATTEVYALRPNHGTNARFLDYVLRSSEFRQYGTARLTGAGGLKRLSSTDLKNFEITLPSPDEQRAIADYLDRETARIDTLIAEQRKLVELARERRSALITAAVTGQIDVRKAS